MNWKTGSQVNYDLTHLFFTEQTRRHGLWPMTDNWYWAIVLASHRDWCEPMLFTRFDGQRPRWLTAFGHKTVSKSFAYILHSFEFHQWTRYCLPTYQRAYIRLVAGCVMWWRQFEMVDARSPREPSNFEMLLKIEKWTRSIAIANQSNFKPVWFFVQLLVDRSHIAPGVHYETHRTRNDLCDKIPWVITHRNRSIHKRHHQSNQLIDFVIEGVVVFTLRRMASAWHDHNRRHFWHLQVIEWNVHCANGNAHLNGSTTPFVIGHCIVIDQRRKLDWLPNEYQTVGRDAMRWAEWLRMFANVLASRACVWTRVQLMIDGDNSGHMERILNLDSHSMPIA